MPIWVWVAFHAAVFAMLAIDLGVFHRHAHEVSVREAAGWTVTWVSASMLLCLAIARFMGTEPALQFLTGYLIEQALSVDNIFVFVLIFSYFAVPKRYQHRILFWGILGALVLRGTMIGAGTWLIHRFAWVLYLFGAFLVFTGIRMAFAGEEGVEVEANPVVRLIRRLLPVTKRYHGQRFTVRVPVGRKRRLIATPLLVVLVMVETTDLIFAVDSIPAIFAVTTDPFLVYTSNICAILGLRSLYFLLAGIIGTFRFLQIGLSVVLVFVGAKMLITDWYRISIGASLAVVVGVLLTSVIASLLLPTVAEEHSPVEHDPLHPTSRDAPLGDEEERRGTRD
ncbi:MAG TPA: TerC family protein [Candidatus Dormibacteraeota bacterium]|nr:TerC family protein [Candidatus Dormibacteraeota bacterium]